MNSEESMERISESLKGTIKHKRMLRRSFILKEEAYGLVRIV